MLLVTPNYVLHFHVPEVGTLYDNKPPVFPSGFITLHSSDKSSQTCSITYTYTIHVHNMETNSELYTLTTSSSIALACQSSQTG